MIGLKYLDVPKRANELLCSPNQGSIQAPFPPTRKTDFKVELLRLDRAGVRDLLDDGQITKDSPGNSWQFGLLQSFAS